MDNLMRMDEFIWEFVWVVSGRLSVSWACLAERAQRSRWPSGGQDFLLAAKRLAMGTKKAGRLARLFCALDQTLGQGLCSSLFRLAACNPLGRANQ